MNRLAGLLIIIVAVLAACGGPSSKKKLELLDEAILHYNQALRWGRYDDAEEYHLSREGKLHTIDPAALSTIRITGLSVRSKELNEEMNEATVTGEINYYRTDYGTLKQAPFSQHWWYAEESKKWLLDSEPPAFK